MGWALPPERNQGLLLLMIRYRSHFDPYGSFTLHGTRTGTGKWWVSILCYVLYTLHRNRDKNREPLFSIVPIPFPVPIPIPAQVLCSVFKPLVWNTILFWQAFNYQKVFMHTEIFLNVIQKLSIAKHFSLFYSYQISLEQKLQWSMDHCFCYGLYMVIHYDRCLLAEIRVYAGITTSIISFNVNNT